MNVHADAFVLITAQVPYCQVSNKYVLVNLDGL
jgi:hypothetical protein